MYQGQRIGAVILMAGSGSRFGGDIPKQFLRLGDKKVYLHTLEAFLLFDLLDEIVLVCHPDWIDIVNQEVASATVVSGGLNRQESCRLGLLGFSKKPDIVMIHDAVRPFVSKEILFENVRLAALHGAVDTCVPSTDTVVYAPKTMQIESIPKRESYLRGQTPQTFRFTTLLEAHEAALSDGVTGVSDDCQLVLRRGCSVSICLGSEINFKITTDLDFKLASMLVVN